MGTYLHYFETEAEYEDAIKGPYEEKTILADEFDTYRYMGVNPDTGRHIWRGETYKDIIYETIEEVPDVENGFTYYDFYDGDYEETNAAPGEFTKSIVGSRGKSLYTTPWVSLTESRGVNYNYKYQYVDLGLPSGILWATTNVGALMPEMYGNYYAWGEIFTKSAYTWNNYTLGGSANHPNKYNDTDNLCTLELVDDVAHSVMGENWRMPTIDEFYELINGTNYQWTSLNGVNGARLTSKSDNSKSIFIPAAGGYRSSNDGEFGEEGEKLWLWTSTKISYPWLAGATTGGENGMDTEAAIGRQEGLTVRGVMNGRLL